MTPWVEASIALEQQRRARVLEFMEAAETFLASLEEDFNRAIHDYDYYFPKEPIEVHRTRVEISVSRCPEPRSDYSVLDPLNSIGYGDPIQEAFIWFTAHAGHAGRVPASERLGGAVPAIVHEGSLLLGTTGGGVTNDNIVEHMLMPVLFPGLVRNPGILSYLRQELGLRGI